MGSRCSAAGFFFRPRKWCSNCRHYRRVEKRAPETQGVNYDQGVRDTCGKEFDARGNANYCLTCKAMARRERPAPATISRGVSEGLPKLQWQRRKIKGPKATRLSTFSTPGGKGHELVLHQAFRIRSLDGQQEWVEWQDVPIVVETPSGK